MEETDENKFSRRANVKRTVKEKMVDKNDAMVIDCLDVLIKAYEDFMNGTLKVDASKENEMYESPVAIRNYYNDTDKVSKAFINMTDALRNARPQVAMTFAPKIEEIEKAFKAVSRKGNKEPIFKLRNDFRDLRLRLINLIESGNPEKMLETYAIMTEERAQKVWTSGKKKLAKHPEAIILLQWLVKEGHGIPMNVSMISNIKGDSIQTIRMNLNIILENATELLFLGKEADGSITYYVPKEFHPFQFG